MAIDTRQLTPTELVRMLNSTPLGVVTSVAKVGRQMNAAGFRIGDGKRINLLRYVAWLARERDKPRTPKLSVEEARARDLAAKNAARREAQDIGEIPPVQDGERRQKACEDFRFFCETYFPDIFYLPWSKDHLRVIEKIETAVVHGGLFAFAMPRGSGKSVLCRMAALWAILTGRRKYVCLIGSAADQARNLLQGIQAVLLRPQSLLLADFPEVVYPIQALENSAHKQRGQRYRGELTFPTWTADKIVVPTIPGSAASGSVITVDGLDSNIRGQQHSTIDGRVLRPDLVLVDDPQTRESAQSLKQTVNRLAILNGDVLGLAGPGCKISGLLTCTKIYAGDLADQLLDRDKNPEWQGECTKMVYSFPTHEKLWDQYAAIRAESLRTGNGGREATEFYQRHQAEMDAGAEVAWPARYNTDEASAVQHAMNLKLRDREAFFAEYQNEPVSQQVDDTVLTPDKVAERFNGRKRGEVPLSAGTLTMFVDVHDAVLFYHNNGSLAAWAKVWDYLVEGIFVKPPASPQDGFYYAVAFGATGDWEGQDGKVARWDADPGEWTFIDAPEGTVVRVHPGLQGSSWRMYIGRDHLRTTDDRANLNGKLMEHDGTAWKLAADQAGRPDLVTTHGRARHGDFIGPWVFNELHAAIGLLKKTRHVCTFGQGPDPDAILRRAWYPGGSLSWETDWWESGWGPYEETDSDGNAWRGSPWGRITDLHPGMFATMEWFFVPEAPWYQEAFHDFGEGWVQDKQNLWRTDAHVETADPHFSADRFGTLDRPTEFPQAGTWGYYATWHAVAAWDFEYGW